MKVRFGVFFLFLFSLFTLDVSAASATLNVGQGYCYNSSGKYSTSSCVSNTLYKQLKVDGAWQDAWCVQANWDAAPDGSTLKSVSYGNVSGESASWSKENALIAGEIIRIIQSNKDYDKKNKYVYTFSALNRYFKELKFKNSKSFSNDVAKKAVDEAKKVKFYTSKELPSGAISASFVSNVLDHQSVGVYVGKVKVSASNTYSDGDITYKVSNCTNCTVYTDASLKNAFSSFKVAPGKKYETTLYVKAASTVKPKDQISVQFTGSSSHTYNIATLWNYNSQRQKLVTVSKKTYDHSKSYAVSAIVPDPVNKTLVFSKIDSGGNNLAGANITVNVPGVNKSCSTNGQATCSISFSDDVASVNYEVTEAKAPNGYIIAGKLPGTWTIGTNVSTCYRISNVNETAVWTKLTSVTDCDAEYVKKDVCVDKNGTVLTDITSQEDCEKINNDNTGDQTNPEGGEDNTDPGTEPDQTPSPVEGEDDTNNNENNENNENNDGSTDNTTGSDETLKSENIWKTWCYNKNNQYVDDNGETSKCSYDYMKITSNGNNLYLTMTNTYNSISFSKRNTSNQDLAGAKLKVCTKADYDKDKLKCAPYKAVNGDTLEWVSSTSSTTFYGFAIGTYYLIEEEAANGYILNNVPIEFAIDKDGKVALGKNSTGKLDENTIIITNEITKISVSKQDIATSKELPGANINICVAGDKQEDGTYPMVVDNDGNCITAILADGTPAMWTSSDKVHEIVGLASGTYYLVETKAPDGYSTAESVLFILNEDGTLTDKDGNLLSDKKLVMYDKELEEVKTGMFSVYIVGGIFVAVVGIGFGTYYYMGKRNPVVKSSKIRKRKIHNSSF